MVVHSANILNFHPIDERIAIGGQPQLDQFKMLKDDGFEVVIRLNMRDTGSMIHDEQKQLMALGVTSICIEMAYAAPTEAHIRYFFEVMEIYQGKKVYVHDATGYGASTLMALYLMHQGLLLEEAQQCVLPGWQPSDLWWALLERNTDIVA
ncbi:hypothetical protein G4Y79_00090 [Phototrophicus methaneseepsis]|uniref:DSP-PTPase phosphatase fused to NAD+ Kinase domain-containing protein n=1 Tax=Phototrophicus methaneseepsis TaxID=2710758 RepID=A0A7S8E9E3_9CHLR|nr:hypothetical protein [Phototrophicus methaneseepsis]QPC82810.1 hypothetical protein G4Y79_00090 [Phototrophicus methaneseepsis]